MNLALALVISGSMAVAATAPAQSGPIADQPLSAANIGADPAFSFTTHILPILTKAGCNSGACHGAAIGQGGFRLSLLGYDPETDHDNITRELGGRRIDLSTPELSLMLRKPAKQIDHEGGLRLPRNSENYRRLAAWIASGAPFGNKNLSVQGISVSPADSLLARTNDIIQLRVRATLSNGIVEDVTPLALYTSNDDSLAQTEKSGAVTLLRQGVTTIMVRYGGQVAAARVGVPFQGEIDTGDDFVPHNFIDQLTLAEFKRLRLPPSELSSDSTFLRRLYLDVIGQLPSESETRSFLERDTKDADARLAARQRIIDDLLTRPAFADFWTLKLADLLLIHSKRLGETAARSYHSWLRRQIAHNVGFHQIITDLFTATGNVEENGPANFYRLKQDPRDMADFVSQAVLGIRIGCARCHNHPSDRWTQNDYHQFAAYFARVSFNGKELSVSPRGEVLHPKTQKPVLPRPLGAPPTPQATTNEADRRLALARSVLDPNNPLLARALVNRVWKELMGRGLVEPVDDLRLTNPPSHPALFEALTSEFLRNNYDLRHLIRTIVSSRTYQLSSEPNALNRADDRFFSRAYLKPLAAQVLADAIAQVTDTPDEYDGYPAGTRAVVLVDPQTPAYHLDVLGRCPREAICETSTRTGGGLAQALHLINGPTINNKLTPAIRSLAAQHQNAASEPIHSLYLRTLSRFPTQTELTHWNSVILTAQDRTEALEDLLWALLNCREFAFNH